LVRNPHQRAGLVTMVGSVTPEAWSVKSFRLGCVRSQKQPYALGFRLFAMGKRLCRPHIQAVEQVQEIGP
jgi:hypothetical protein